MANKTLTAKECMEIFQKYDKKMYDYYENNMWFLGYNAKRYAQKLKEENEG